MVEVGNLEEAMYPQSPHLTSFPLPHEGSGDAQAEEQAL